MNFESKVLGFEKKFIFESLGNISNPLSEPMKDQVVWV